MASQEERAALAKRLVAALRPSAEPIGIAFVPPGAPTDAPAFRGIHAAPNDAGRTGTVPAGCVFWIEALAGPIATSASDHANCSVGSYTHGFLSLAEAATMDDVAAVLAAGWVDEADVGALPQVRERAVHDALRIEGKPQCHIVAIAKEEGTPAASVGCALSRARTGMKAEEMTCALPGAGLADTVARIEAAADLDRTMARYASADARRFAREV